MIALIQPVHGRISSPFGAPRSYGGHAGIDYAVPTGTIIAAAASGRVTFAGARGDAGNAIIIEHGGGAETRYYHLSRIEAGVGSYVMQGSRIGLSGATGSVTGAHLHFETRLHGSPVNPETALQNGLNVTPDYNPAPASSNDADPMLDYYLSTGAASDYSTTPGDSMMLPVVIVGALFLFLMFR